MSGESDPERPEVGGRIERILPDEEDFDPEAFDAEDAVRALEEGVRLFDNGDYHAAHEAFEKCWLANEAGDADFYKGLVQAAICLHHLTRGNPEGARKLYAGHRRLLGSYLPEHAGLDVAGLLADMQRVMRPVLRGSDEGAMEPPPRIPRLTDS